MLSALPQPNSSCPSGIFQHVSPAGEGKEREGERDLASCSSAPDSCMQSSMPVMGHSDSLRIPNRQRTFARKNLAVLFSSGPFLLSCRNFGDILVDRQPDRTATARASCAKVTFPRGGHEPRADTREKLCPQSGREEAWPGKSRRPSTASERPGEVAALAFGPLRRQPQLL